jgi:His-Xaa-Ser system protein HxsD
MTPSETGGLSLQETLVFETQLCSAEVLERAAYRFIGSMALDLQRHEVQWHCRLCFDPGITEEQCVALLQAFRKEVLDQKLRASIRAQTEDARILILARAFSRTGLVPES